jgi:hypothetical protein
MAWPIADEAPTTTTDRGEPPEAMGTAQRSSVSR